jgi:hypothetical protein
MERTPRLYETQVPVFSQHENWVDRQHLQTLAWMMVGLSQAAEEPKTKPCQSAPNTRCRGRSFAFRADTPYGPSDISACRASYARYV